MITMKTNLRKFIYGILIPMILWGVFFATGDQLAIRTARSGRRRDDYIEDDNDKNKK